MKVALFDFIGDSKIAGRGYLILFFRSFSRYMFHTSAANWRSNLLCRTTAQKDLTAIGARASEEPCFVSIAIIGAADACCKGTSFR